MKRVLLVSAVAAVLALGIQSRAEAALSLTLHVCQGATCVDFGPASSPINAGAFTVGDYSVGNVGGAGTQGAFAQSQETQLQVQRVSDNSAAALNAWLTITGYTLPVGTSYNLDTTLGATKTGTTSSLISYQAWFSNTNSVGFPPGGSTPTPVISCTPPTSTSVQSTSCSTSGGTVPAPPGIPFSLVSDTIINSALGDRSLYGSTGQVSVTAVPEPVSVMLLGTGLLGLGASIRRRMKK